MSRGKVVFAAIEIERFLVKIREFKSLKKGTILAQFASKERTDKLLKYCVKQGYLSRERDSSRNLVYSLSKKGEAWLGLRGKPPKKTPLFTPSKRLQGVRTYRVDPTLLQMGIPVESII